MGFTTASTLVNELIEASKGRDAAADQQKRLARLKLLIIDELGFVPLSPTEASDALRLPRERIDRSF